MGYSIIGVGIWYPSEYYKEVFRMDKTGSEEYYFRTGIINILCQIYDLKDGIVLLNKFDLKVLNDIVHYKYIPTIEDILLFSSILEKDRSTIINEICNYSSSTNQFESRLNDHVENLCKMESIKLNANLDQITSQEIDYFSEDLYHNKQKNENDLFYELYIRNEDGHVINFDIKSKQFSLVSTLNVGNYCVNCGTLIEAIHYYESYNQNIFLCEICR